MFPQHRIIPLPPHQRNKRSEGKRRLVRAGEYRREGIDGAVGRDDGGGGERLAEEDGEEGELFEGGDGGGDGVREGGAGVGAAAEEGVVEDGAGEACGS